MRRHRLLITTIEIHLLEMPYHPERLVIENHHSERQFFSYHELKFLDIHLHAAIATKTDDRATGTVISPDPCRQCVAHRPETTRKQNFLLVLALKRLRNPYLVLPNIRCDDAPIFNSFANSLYILIRYMDIDTT